jgi:hypothetical protein
MKRGPPTKKIRTFLFLLFTMAMGVRGSCVACVDDCAHSFLDYGHYGYTSLYGDGWSSVHVEGYSQVGVRVYLVNDYDLARLKSGSSFASYAQFSPSYTISCINMDGPVKTSDRGINLVAVCVDFGGCDVRYKLTGYKDLLSSNDDNTNYYIGGGVAAGVVIIAACVLVYCCCCKKKPEIKQDTIHQAQHQEQAVNVVIHNTNAPPTGNPPTSMLHQQSYGMTHSPSFVHTAQPMQAFSPVEYGSYSPQIYPPHQHGVYMQQGSHSTQYPPQFHPAQTSEMHQVHQPQPAYTQTYGGKI